MGGKEMGWEMCGCRGDGRGNRGLVALESSSRSVMMHYMIYY